MFHISVSNLRHYEKAGLLTPAHVSPDSGYRYYGMEQFEALNTIRYLRALDMPLAEIADFLQNRVTAGSFGELWSLKKALRRFLWHDRIHAKALWRMAGRIWPDIPDPFCFGGTD